MYLRIGGRLRPFNEVRSPLISYKPIYNAQRQMIAVEETWQLSGRIVQQTNATQTRMTAAIQQLKSDVSQTRPDLEFLEDNGVTPSAFRLLASECYDGPLASEVSFPSDGRDIYPTGMMWTATFTAKRVLGGIGNPVLEFSESVANPTGGTVNGFVGGAINLPERQIFKQNEPYTYIQSGSCVGMFGWLNPPPPLWPGAQTRRNQPVNISPRIQGPVPMEFETRWTYEFANEYPLLGDPHILF